MPPILVTGAAGFIGFHVAQRLLADGQEVVGVDNLNAYYDPALKRARLDRLIPHPAFRFERLDVSDRSGMADLFRRSQPVRVVHLAAQAGVRYSLQNPSAYVDANLVGFLNILEGCRHQAVEHLVFASSSSVYGANTRLPFSVHDNVDHPLSLYAATKKANELMAHSYAHLYGLPCTGLRFFTVYGPWGRPDMALFLFTQAILEGRPIDVFNDGKMQRDFTFVDDVVDATVAAAERGEGLYNVGGGSPASLNEALRHIGEIAGVPVPLVREETARGHVRSTWADTTRARRDLGWAPRVGLREGLERQIDALRALSPSTRAAA